MTDRPPAVPDHPENDGPELTAGGYAAHELTYYDDDPADWPVADDVPEPVDELAELADLPDAVRDFASAAVVIAAEALVRAAHAELGDVERDAARWQLLKNHTPELYRSFVDVGELGVRTASALIRGAARR